MKNNDPAQSKKSSLRWFLAVIAVLPFAALILGPQLRAQGTLTPPGAPAPTMKTLDQIEPRTPISSLPFTISQSGSYYLTASLTAATNANGITINASNVTLDLRGFEVIGTPGTAVFGIRVSVGRSNVTIRDGTVRNWPGSGVVVENTAVTRVRVENVHANDNGSGGIVLGTDSVAANCTASGNVAHGISGQTGCQVLRCTASAQTNGTADGFNFGAQTVMTDCVAKANGQDGITTGQDSVLANCLADGNAAIGFVCGDRTVVDRCLASDNGSTGFRMQTGCSVTHSAAYGNVTGFLAQDACALENFSARSNSGDGITTGNDCVLQCCTVQVNQGNGITAGTGATITSCTAALNQGVFGISVGAGSTVANCTARANTSTAATSAGITAGFGCTISGCTVSDTTSTAATLTNSTGMGIAVSNGSTVQHCTVRNNRGDGVRATTDCRVLDNGCETSGLGTGDGAGIHITATNNRVDGNHVANNDRGIDVDFGANTIVRNTASGNLVNYDIVTGNSVGAIVNPANSAVIAGNGALASSLGTTDPWANFSE